MIIPYIIWVHIHAACEKYQVDEVLFIAIGLTEKGKYAWTDAVLGDLTLGLSISPMQLYLSGAGSPPPGWDKQAWANELTKPEIWAPVAASYIRQNLDEFNGDLESAISAYNQGAQGVRKNGKEANRPYINKVLENYQFVKTEGITVIGSGDHDRQTFIPATKKWTGPYAEYAPIGGGYQEALANLKGIATDALEAGRIGREHWEAVKKTAEIMIADWGNR